MTVNSNEFPMNSHVAFPSISSNMVMPLPRVFSTMSLNSCSRLLPVSNPDFLCYRLVYLLTKS